MPRCAVGATLPPQATELLQWWQGMQQASRQFGKPMDLSSNMEEIMQSCGFTDITHRTYQIPLWARKNKGETDEEEKRKDHLCSWWQSAMSAPAEESTFEPSGFEALTMSLFVRQLGMNEADVRALCHRLEAIIVMKRLPVYFNL